MRKQKIGVFSRSQHGRVLTTVQRAAQPDMLTSFRSARAAS
jgi:hypothetical protein